MIVIAGIVGIFIFIGVIVLIVVLKKRKSTPSCVPNCEGKCGGVDDGCGGACNGCSDGENCLGITCGIRPPCVPKCEGKCEEVWDGCTKKGEKGKCPKDCPPDYICRRGTCFKKPLPPDDPRKSNCKSDAECAKFSDKGLTQCDVWNEPSSGCVSPNCTDNDECYNDALPYCDENRKICVKDKCEAMLGPNWATINNRCLPKCSSDKIGRSNTGWCMESETSNCPEGWELKTVIGNPSGLSRGSEAHRTACVPTDQKAKPNGWGAIKNGVYVPYCGDDQKEPQYREEGWCLWNGDAGCENGYSKFTSSSDDMGKQIVIWKTNYVDFCAPVPN